MANNAPEIRVALTAEDKGVAAAIRELNSQLKDLKRTDDATAVSADRMAGSFAKAGASMREARGSARLLSQDLGVGLNRELASTLARSSVLGPVLGAAFPVVAALGFYQVIKQGAEELSTLISDTFIFTKEMKAAYAALQAGNKEIEKSVQHTKTLKDEFELIGLSGIQKDTILLARLSDELDKVKQKRSDAEDVLFLNRRYGQGTEADVQAAQQSLLEAKAKSEEIVQEQYNLEKSALIQQQKDAESAAAKRAAKAVQLEERKDQEFAKQAAQLQKAMQDEIELYKANEREREESEKNSFDRGLETIQQYFVQRRTDLQTEMTQETDLIAKERDAAQKEADRAGAEGIANQARSKAAGGADTTIGATYGTAAQKDFERQEASLAKVGELTTKLQVLQTDFRTKGAALDTEEFKAREENQKQRLEFEKLLDTTGGKRLEAAKAEIAIEKQKLAVILAQSGASQAEIDQKLVQYEQVKTSEAEFAEAQRKTQQDLKAFEIEKQRIELEAKTRKINQIEAEKEVNDLIAARLPLLRADTQAETAAAQKTGNQDNVAAAQAAAAGVENVKVSAVSLGDTLRGSISNDFGNFFMNLGRSTASAANQFRSLASSVVASLEQILVKLLLVKIFGGATGEAGGGAGLLGGLFGAGHAEGGLIHGPGGPKSDSIPARVSPGEYILSADAVSAVGVPFLETINRGLNIPSIERLSLPKFAEGGLVGAPGAGGGDSNINLGIALDEGLILKHLSSKAAGNIILTHLANNPKAASKAISRSS